MALLDAGVGCMTADAMSNFAFLFRDPQALANETMAETEHPSFGGRYWRHAPMVSFSATPGTARPYCELGEHTRALLQELGYDQDQMTELHDGGVVGWPTAQTDAVSVSS